MTATIDTKTYTAEEYLAQEVAAETRSEFRNGEIVTMAGGTPEHSKIAGAMHALAWLQLRKQPYTTFVTDSASLAADNRFVCLPGFHGRS